MLTEQEIDELIQQAQAGDEHALAQLFDSYRPRLVRMIQLRMDPSLRARVDEDDVLQDTFIELARKIREYSRVGELPFFLWLRMTAGETLFKLYHKHVDVKMRTAKQEIGIFQRVPNASTFFVTVHGVPIDHNILWSNRKQAQQQSRMQNLRFASTHFLLCLLALLNHNFSKPVNGYLFFLPQNLSVDLHRLIVT